jgi:pyruvate ferredoxin oxidoreductase alpha subunit
VQLDSASGQEVLHDVLAAYRIAETALVPVLVNLEGFLLSHTAEVVAVPSQRDVDAFLPRWEPPAEWLLDPDRPRTYSACPPPRDYAAFQRNAAAALERAGALVDEVAVELGARFGQPCAGAIDVAGDPDADTALIAMGTIGDTALELAGDDVLLVRVHAYRPFPAAQLEAALAGVSRAAVIDRVQPFGALAPLAADVRGLDLPHLRATGFVAGVGGTEVTPATLRWAVDRARDAFAERPVQIPEAVG